MFIEYVWLVPLLPLLAFGLILWLRGRAPAGGAALAIPATGASALLSLGMLWEVWTSGATYETNVRWMTIGPHSFELGFLVDELSVFLAALASFLSFLIIVYSMGYMAKEGPRLPRYYAQMTLFVAGMLGTVLADNYLLMFMSWEIMGLCSYLLIGFWFDRPAAASAAKKAFLVTRLGDISLLLGLIILYRIFGTFSYREIFENTQLIGINAELTAVASLLILGGAIGKSAQFPLHVWLPDAMEGPTTVSALIHAATMVKAGVFLVARSFPLYVHTPQVFLWVGVAGAITAVVAATMALVQWDIKRVLAYSTLSQLGYMFLALGAGGWIAALTGDPVGYVSGLFHLMSHAFTKALLFLAAGSVILAVHHHNDMRRMGGLHAKMPVTSWTMLIGALAMAGIPPFSGFWSKDEVLASVQKAGQLESGLFTVLWVLALSTAVLTAFYMFRMWFLTFSGRPKSRLAQEAKESPVVMTLPLVILAFFAAVAGFFLFFGLTDFLNFNAHDWVPDVAEVHPHGGTTLLVEILINPWTWVGLALAVVGLWTAYAAYASKRIQPGRAVAMSPGADVHRLLVNLYYYDRLFMGAGEKIGMGLARASRGADDILVDGAVRGVGRTTVAAGQGAARFQTGRVTTYAATFIIGAAVVVVAVVWFGRILRGVL